jgi:hypothetical protein
MKDLYISKKLINQGVTKEDAGRLVTYFRAFHANVNPVERVSLLPISWLPSHIPNTSKPTCMMVLVVTKVSGERILHLCYFFQNKRGGGIAGGKFSWYDRLMKSSPATKRLPPRLRKIFPNRPKTNQFEAKETNQLYAFKYLRADMEEVELGPFLTKQEAGDRKTMMATAGAICTEVFPIEGDIDTIRLLTARKKGYILGLMEEFRAYLQKELAVLDCDGVAYGIVYDYINELRTRIRRYVDYHVPKIMNSAVKKARLIQRRERREFLAIVAAVLKKKSGEYSPSDGSVPEDIGRLLQELAAEILDKP